MFLSEDEIVEDIYKNILRMSVAEMWMGMTDQDIGKYHFTVGRHIRNNYGLWDSANPHVNLQPTPNKVGIIDDPKFPDNMTFNIMKRVRDRCKEYTEATITFDNIQET